MRSRALPLLVLAALALITALAWPVDAADVLKVRAEPGVTEVELEGALIRIQTTETVLVYLTVEAGSIIGTVEGEGTDTALVTLTLVGPPDEILFHGRVGRGNILRDFLPHETGQGEM